MNGKHVLLTGASGGLGGEVTAQFLAGGATVVAPVIEGRDQLADRFASAGDALRVVEGDLTEEKTVAAIVDGMDRIDALVHLVGGFTMGPTHEIELDAWRRFHDLALTTTLLCCKHALRRMRSANYGRIVTIGSKNVAFPSGQVATYASAKAGVVALTQTIAAETAGTGVTANVVLPSIIDTPANRAAMGEHEVDRWVSPRSLGEVILFLASEAAGDLRGASVPVYGSV
ncbi:MAG: 3-oxoacyl-ACP reductase FabG [Myxococcota bacterium]